MDFPNATTEAPVSTGTALLIRDSNESIEVTTATSGGPANTCSDADTVGWTPLSPTGYTAATAILCVCTIMATPSNLLAIWVVAKTPFLRVKAVNMLIVNLCLIDLVTSCIDLPLIWIILHRNHIQTRNDPVICKFQLFIHSMAISGQLWSFVSVGYERYHTVSNPFDKENIRRITHLLVASCWLLAILIPMVELQLAPDTIDFDFCMHLPLHRSKHYGLIFIMAPFGVLCFVLVAYFYGRIVWLVRKHCKNVNTTCRKLPLMVSGTGNGIDISNCSELPSIYGEICVLDSRNRSLGKRRIEAETAKRSLFVILSFLAFTLPYPAMVLFEKTIRISYQRSWYEVQYCLHVMSLLSSGLNPLIYGLANRQFRNAFAKIYHRYHRRYHSRDYL